jgi:hypothetical protein
MARFLPFTFFFIALSLLAVTASAQLTDIDTAGFQLRLSSQGSLLMGNVERLLLMPSAELALVREMWGVKTSNTYQYGTFAKRKTEDDVVSRNFIYLFPKTSFYPYAMIWLERNFRRGIDFRYQAGIGASYVLFTEEHHRLKLSLTLTREVSAFKTNLAIATTRFTARLLGKHVLFDNALRLRYEIWIQPSLEDSKNLRSHIDSILEIPLSTHLSLLASLNFTRESIVLPTVRENDMLLLFGFSVVY